MAAGPNKKQIKRIASNKLEIRNSVWPGLDEGDLWSWQKSDGWLNIPRALPIILQIMDNMSKGKPVSSTYLDLWCRTFDDSFVIASKPREMAFFSGFTGERAERTWASRIAILKSLGFIDVQSGSNGPISYILIRNPYHALRDLHGAGKIDATSWNALREKMIEIRAKDFDPPATGDAEAASAAAPSAA